MDCHLFISFYVTRLPCNAIVILLTGKIELYMYFHPSMDYSTLLSVIISIPLSNQVIFLACL